MGLYDTLYYGKTSVQVKCFGSRMRDYYVGNIVPLLHHYDGYRLWDKNKQVGTYTIVLPDYASYRYVLIKNRTFIRLTNEEKETYPPFISKCGEVIEQEENE